MRDPIDIHINTRGCPNPPSDELRATIAKAALLITTTHCDMCGALITRDGFVERSTIDPMLCAECADDVHGNE